MPQKARVPQGLLQVAQHLSVGGGVVAQKVRHLVEVHVGARGTRGFCELVQAAYVAHGAGGLAQAHGVVAVERFGPGPVQVGADAAQVRVQLAHQVHQLLRAEGLGRKLHELGALLRGHGVEQALGGRGALGEQLNQLLDAARVLRELAAVLCHELVEVLLGGHAGAVLAQKYVQVAQHLGHRGAVLVGGPLECILHAGEALVQKFAADEVLDLLILLAGVVRSPVVLVQLGHRGGRGGGQVVQRHLLHGAVELVHVHVAGELAPFGEHSVVEKLLCFLERASEVGVTQQLLAALGDLAQDIVVALAAQVLLHRLLGGVAEHDVVGDGAHRLGQVGRRGERVGARGVLAVAAVAIHRWSRPLRNP